MKTKEKLIEALIEYATELTMQIEQEKNYYVTERDKEEATQEEQEELERVMEFIEELKSN